MKPTTPLGAVEGLAAHEMVHVFMNGLDRESWFEEGIAVMYQSRAPYLAGLFYPTQYIDDINKTARTYYSNVRYDMPMAEATKEFWTDARARLQSYVRGGLYFYQLDAKLKAKTNGKRGLDQVLHDFIAARNAGRSVTVQDFISLVARDLGPEAEADYQAMMAGKRIVVPENAFGRCFRRKTEQMPIFELGFAMKSLMQQPRVIADLDPASPAAKAGLRDGDNVLSATPLDGAQEDPDREMRVTVARDGKPLDIHFKPKGTKTLDGYQWERVPGLPDGACRL
jgi:predicted metalloprotease with PDZ domain